MGRKPLAAVLAACVLAGLGASVTQTNTVKQDQTLEARAYYLANHGGIRSSAYADATPAMKQLSRLLVAKTFRRAGTDAVRWALCVIRRESGENPGAVNVQSGAAGLFQFLGHPQWSTWRILHDPAYAVGAAWSLSHGARDRSPWWGGSYAC